MREHWQKVRLGEVLRHRKEFVTIDDLTTYKRPRVRLHAAGIVLRDELPGALIKTKHQQVCRAGDLLVAEIDAKVGGFGTVPEALDGSIVSSHYFLFDVDKGKLDGRFLDYFIRTPAFRDQVEAQGSTNYAAIRPTHVLAYEMPLPPLAKQRRVVARIEELAAQIHEARSTREHAALEADALLLRAVAYRLDEIEERASLGEVCQTTSGGTPSRDRPDFFFGSVPWIKSGELEDSIIGHAQEHVSEEALSESSAKLFPRGTLLVALYGATVGKTGVLGIEAATNQAICAVFPSDVLDRDFVWWFLRRMRPEFLKASFGGAQPNISQRALRGTEIPVPPLWKQRQIVAELNALQVETAGLKRLQAETAVELDALLPAVLDRAFKGEL